MLKLKHSLIRVDDSNWYYIPSIEYYYFKKIVQRKNTKLCNIEL